MLAGIAVPPWLSDAFSVMVSDGVVASVSDSVPSAVFTAANEPLMVRLAVPLPVAPVADSLPFVSDSVTVKVSPFAIGDFAMLTPLIAPA